jgi:rubrerythrin
MRAFAGESQARNRYTIAANEARRERHEALAEVFLYTADQEREHAEIFYRYLKDAAGENIRIDGAYPVDISGKFSDLVRMAQHNEYQEHGDVYPAFARKAQEEGFEKIARSFSQIAAIEKIHGDRFGKFAEYLEQGKLYVSDVSTGWICLNCGFVYEGLKAPMRCPVCDHDQGFFIRMELSPFL